MIFFTTQEILIAADIAYCYDADEGTMDALPPAIEVILACTVREGVTNVIRHSRAHQCTIRVIRDGHYACVEVSDDGAGVPQVAAFQPKGVTSPDSMNEGNNPLTEREREVLAAATSGASIAEIAASLFLSEGRVRKYLSMAIQKLGAQNRVEAARIAEQKGWL
jgi:DNA-binding NarL/FixJ family response regulator